MLYWLVPSTLPSLSFSLFWKRACDPSVSYWVLFVFPRFGFVLQLVCKPPILFNCLFLILAFILENEMESLIFELWLLLLFCLYTFMLIPPIPPKVESVFWPPVFPVAIIIPVYYPPFWFCIPFRIALLFFPRPCLPPFILRPWLGPPCPLDGEY